MVAHTTLLEISCTGSIIYNNSKVKTLISILELIKSNNLVSNLVCTPSDDSDQPAHPCSLIRAFASRLSIL